MAASTSSSEPAPGERTLRIVVEYDGTSLCGWQRQNNGPTVQQHLEEGLRQMTQEDTQIIGASRTDAGVHALGQVAVFKTRKSIPPHGFRRGLNGLLPECISVRSIEEVDASFHPRFDAVGKHYRYSILNREPPSPLQRERSWHISKRLDTGRMQEAAYVLMGEHDFSAFRASGCGAHTPHRRIDKITVLRSGDLVYVDVWGNAFLRNMVRILAGTLVDVGRGDSSPELVRAILEGLDRRRAGMTAPAQGLSLIEVFYPPASRPSNGK